MGETLFENVVPNPIREKCDLDIKDTWFDLSAIERADVVRVQYFMAVLSKEPVTDGVAGCQMFEFSKTQLRGWFKFKAPFIYASPFTHVFHLRFWDPKVSNWCAPWYSSETHPCANITRESYERSAEAFGYDPLDFEDIHERTPHTLPGIPTHLQFVCDFQALSQSSVCFRANSSFSWLAAALGHGKVYSPMMSEVRGDWVGNAIPTRFISGNEGSFFPGGLVGQSELIE